MCIRDSAYSQRDPLVEYQREGFDMFAAMMDGIKEEAVGFLFNLEVQVEEDDDDDSDEPLEEAYEPLMQPEGSAQRAPAPTIRAKGLEAPAPSANLSYSAPSEDGEAEVKGGTVTTADDEFAGVGRNQKCPCGSGKKFKQCHGAPGGPTGLTARSNG